MLPPTELTLSHHFRNCGTFNCDPGKETSGQRMGDAAPARFRSPVDAGERVETQNTTVERNVRVPADVEESADDLMGDGINIAALAGRDRAQHDPSLRSGPPTAAPEPCSKGLLGIEFDGLQNRRRMTAICAHGMAGVDVRTKPLAR